MPAFKIEGTNVHFEKIWIRAYFLSWKQNKFSSDNFLPAFKIEGATKLNAEKKIRRKNLIVKMNNNFEIKKILFWWYFA